MASGPLRPEQPERYDEPDEQSEPPADQLADPSILERVLEETLSESEAGTAVAPEELEALVQVARRHRGSSLVLEPVAVELVEAVLRARFSQLRISPAAWKRLSREIAGTLYDDPHLQQRLGRFWGQLSELAK